MNLLNGAVSSEFRVTGLSDRNEYVDVDLDSDITVRQFQKAIKKAAELNCKSRDIFISSAYGIPTMPVLKDNKDFVDNLRTHKNFFVTIKDYFKPYTDNGTELEFRVQEHSWHNEYVTVNLTSDITTSDFQKLIKTAAKLKCKSRNIEIFSSYGRVTEPLLKDNKDFVEDAVKHRNFQVHVREDDLQERALEDQSNASPCSFKCHIQ